MSSPSAVRAETPESPTPIKALIVTGQNNHNWRATTPVLQDILEQSGRFTVSVATAPTHDERDADADAFRRNMAAFKPDFAQYDVVILDYNGVDWAPETKRAFEEYMENGGGLVIYHAASNSFPNWEAFNRMIGLGGWNRGHLPATAGTHLYWQDGGPVTSNEAGRPRGHHGPRWAYLIEVRTPEHPVMAGLPPAFRHGTDELYDFMWGPAENVTILATAYASRERGGSGRHEPILLTVSYGEGRIFHTMLGCGPGPLRYISFIETFLRGTEWAATGEVTFTVPDDFPGVDEPSMR
jgi:type 1 glutamine amidotransferase